jgi:hypothetical protein
MSAQTPAVHASNFLVIVSSTIFGVIHGAKGVCHGRVRDSGQNFAMKYQAILR